MATILLTRLRSLFVDVDEVLGEDDDDAVVIVVSIGMHHLSMVMMMMLVHFPIPHP